MVRHPTLSLARRRGFVGAVGQVHGASPASVSVVLVVVRHVVGYDLVALSLVAEELLERQDGAYDQGDLAHDEGLECQEGQSTEEDGNQGCSLELQEQEDRQKGLDDLLLLAAS